MRYVRLRVMVVFFAIIGVILIVPGCPEGTCVGTPMSCNPMASTKCSDADPNTGKCLGCVDEGIIYDGEGIYRGCVDDDGNSISNDKCKPHCKCALGACGRYRYSYALSCDEMMPFDCAGQGCDYIMVDLCESKSY